MLPMSRTVPNGGDATNGEHMRLRAARAPIILASVILAPPPAPEAQQAKVPRIGVLLLSDLEIVQPWFREGLRDVGLIEGQSIFVEYRSAAGRVAKRATTEHGSCR